ncbi:amidohydrolase family protein [Variovorax sp. J22P240]|uniref:amidohydrolase family protein n=1 Tax=Variovorax sp. J22P240 TaxID=3053514 RepID=UPI00257745CB|nr:amidohydrolase family protein [Variovorax sp. J22P240]MDL9997371.1 amidohydrolase family protein [Variovorax sp. J22P240]
MQPTLTYNPHSSAPQLRLPPGACDAHVHVFGPAARFPFAEGRSFTPADAPKETLFALHRHLGIERCVIVQSLCHGYDNRVVEDAIVAGGGNYLGVALLPLGVADEELARLASVGFRGVRFNFARNSAADFDVEGVVAFSRRLEPFGMHLQVHFERGLIHELASPLARSAVPVVVDHMARVDASAGTTHPDFVALHALMQNPLFRVKVSGVDRISRATDYADGAAIAQRLVREFPERCLWGTDWPHPLHDHVPDDGALVDALLRIAPDPDERERLLVGNPRDFYRFDGL